MGQIADFVAQCHAGTHPTLVGRMRSGWVILGSTQILPGYCLLLADPVVSRLNDLTGPARAQYLDDMAHLGDVVLRLTGAVRINYEILGNLEPELHAHVIPRYADEPEAIRTRPIWLHDWDRAPRYEDSVHGALRASIARGLPR